jgi:uncharacterized membrane protein required for colicin V production
VNALDALLLVLLVPFVLRGYRRGLVREIFALAGLVGGLLLAAAASRPLAATMVPEPSPPLWAVAAAFAGVLVVAVVVADLCGRLARGLARTLFLGGVDRLAGILFGSLKGATALGFGLLMAERMMASPSFARSVAGSAFGRPLTEFASAVIDAGRSLTEPAGRAT